MTFVFFSGDCWKGLVSFAYAVPGSEACGTAYVKTGSAEAAAWIALGKALAHLIAAKAPVEELRLLGDDAAVIAALKGTVEPATDYLKSLRDSVREKLKLIGRPTKADLIPRTQNLICTHLSRAAYVGRVGQPVPVPTTAPTKE